MVKFGKHKLRALNKLAKKKNVAGSPSNNNKVLKKKINVEKKVSFQKEVLLKEASETNALVKNVTAQEIILNELAKKPATKKPQVDAKIQVVQPKKVKAVEKQKKRQKTLAQDTRMLLKLMNKK